MDWMLGLLPALTGVRAPVSTDLHDWDGAAAYQRPFAAAADLVFVSGTRLADVDAELAAILRLGRATVAVATLGERGARLLESGAPAADIAPATPPGPVVDTNGAGDAFAAGLVAGRLRGWAWARSAQYAATVAAAACTQHGMEYPPGLLPRPDR
jgi:sugar/nucleoside kinase (ribokinase family)